LNLVLYLNGLTNPSKSRKEPDPPSFWERLQQLF